MSMLTLGQARPTIARALGYCSTDTRIPTLLDEAVQRLLPRGKWVGTYGRWRICQTAGVLTLPRHIETPEQIALCGNPGTIRSEWFMYLGDIGILTDDDSVGMQWIDYGQSVVHTDPTVDSAGDSTCRIRVYAESADDVGTEVHIKYFDGDTGLKVYTTHGGTTVEGEFITLVAPPAYATGTYSVLGNRSLPMLGTSRADGLPSVYGFTKPATHQPVRLYQLDNTTATYTELGRYEPNEYNPVYRRIYLAGFANQTDCTDEDAVCTAKYVDVLGKKRFIPVVNDEDYLLIGNLPALKDEVLSIVKMERNLFDEAKAYEASAISLLQAELDSYLGDGMQLNIKVEDPDVWGVGNVINPI